MSSPRIKKIAFISAFLCVSSAQANQPIDSTARLGLRAGSGTIEGFADVLVPYALSDNALVFVNPRFLLGDAGVDQMNIGVGSRFLFEGKGILGANLYYDKRESTLGFDFEQLGLGLEWLGKLIDARVNVYRAEDTLIMANDFNTLETQVNTDVQQQRSSQSFVSSTDSFGAGRARINQIDQTKTTTTNTRTVNTLRTTTTTTEVNTGRLFEQFQGTLDGWDAEIGIKLPINITPEVRLFAGWYDFEDPFKNNNQLEGYKARAEVRASKYLTFDAEVVEEARNGSDYFLGLRLEIPLKGKDTFKNLKENLWGNPQRTLRERMNSEMVMRDVQIHTDISKPIENEKQRTIRRKQKVEVSSTSSESTDTSTSSSTVVAASNITFVDGDAGGSGAGTFEDPTQTVTDGVAMAGAGGTVFVCDTSGSSDCDLDGGGSFTFDESLLGSGVTLLDNQTITSSITLNGGQVFQTQSKPKIENTSQGMDLGVINTANGNTVNRLEITGQNVSGGYGIANRGSSAASVISNNTITTQGVVFAYGVRNDFNAGSSTVSGNTITTNGGNDHGVYNFANTGSSTVSDNIITTNENDTYGVYNLQNPGSSMISGNIITTIGKRAYGVYNLQNAGSNSSMISGNTITTNGTGAFGVVNRSNSASSTVSGNIITTKGAVAYGVDNIANTGSSMVSGNTITTKSFNAYGVYNHGNTGSMVNGNTITTNGGDAHGVYNQFNNGSSMVSGNTITTKGATAIGVYNVQNSASSTISDNTVTTNGGSNAFGVLNLNNTGSSIISSNTTTATMSEAMRLQGNSGCQQVTGNTLNGNSVDLSLTLTNKITQSDTAALFAANTLVNGTSFGTASSFNCAP